MQEDGFQNPKEGVIFGDFETEEIMFVPEGLGKKDMRKNHVSQALFFFLRPL